MKTAIERKANDLQCLKTTAPGIEKDDFDIEEKEEHGDDVVLDRDPLVGRPDGGHPAFIGSLLAGRRFFLSQSEEAITAKQANPTAMAKKTRIGR